MAFLAHSFINTLSPPEEGVVVAEPQASEVTEQVRPRREVQWNNLPQFREHQDRQAGDQVSSFDSQDDAAKKQARQEVVHRQADELRKLIASGNLPEAYGNLTKEQVDEMEKEGVTIQ